MARLISVFSVENLRKILHYVEKNGTQEVFESFPFAELSGSNGMDYECIRCQLKVLEKFLNVRELYHDDRLKYTIEYLLQNLKFMVKSQNDALLPVLRFLGQVLARCRYFYDENTCQIPVDQTVCLLMNLFNSEQPILEKREGVVLFTELLMVPNVIPPDSKLIQNCVEQCFEILDGGYAADLCRLAYAALGAMPESLALDGSVFHWLKNVCPDLLAVSADEPTLYELLKCIVRLYGNVWKRPECFYRKLSKVYVKKIDVICTLLSNLSLNEFCSRLLIYVVRDMCILHRLPRAALDDERFLKELLHIQTLTDLFPSDGDVVFVLVYLQYCNDERCHPGKTYTLPTLKALSLLYPVIIANGEYLDKEMIGEYLLAVLSKSECFKELITYNPDQLTWFLTRGIYQLKLKALLLWLLNSKDTAVILAVVDACDSGGLLVDVVVHSRRIDESICDRAAELLRRLQGSSLGRILRKNLVSGKSIGYVLEANPGCPTDENEGVFFCKVMSCRLPFLEEKKFFALGCLYSVKLLARFKDNSGGVEQFCWNKKCVELMLRAASGDDDYVAAASIKLLKTLAILQRRHGTKMEQSSTFNFKRLLVGSSEKVSQALLFLHAILAPNVSIPVVQLPVDSGLPLLHRLLELEGDEQVTAKQFKILQRLLQVEKYLTNSAATSLFVRGRCMRPVRQSYAWELLSFLKEWMANLHGLEFYALPYEVLERFLMELRHHPHQEEVDKLMQLLYKWRAFDDY